MMYHVDQHCPNLSMLSNTETDHQFLLSILICNYSSKSRRSYMS